MITISGISPSSARQGDSVIITGTGFTGVTQVLFGNVAVTSFVINSNTQITAVIGNGASGDLYIQGSNGAALDTSVFTFLTSTLPVINSFSPSTQAPGLLVTITGTGFTGTTAVKFGGVNALVFTVISDTEIQAYPNISGSGLVTVTNASGSNSLDGFTLILVKIKMPDSPVIGRVPNDNDLFWIWDSITTKLCQITAANAALYFGTGGGGGGGGGGNIYTALGSPFKVRNIDDSYSFDGTDSKVIDIRLLGKNDYVVYSTDINAEFDNYEQPTAALTASHTGTTEAPDATYPTEAAVTVTGEGSGSQWYVVIVDGIPTQLIQRTGGTGYMVGDTFTIVDLPGITFTITALGGGLGNLIFDEDEGSVTIKNYQLSDNKHLTIYADGVTSTAQQTYILSLRSKMAIYDKVLAPMLATQAIVLPWRKAANLIPVGWQECTDFRGKILIGQDLTDIYDATTNPNGLSQALGTSLGSKESVLDATNIPEITFNLGTDKKGGSSGYLVLSTVNHNGEFPVTFGNATPAPFATLDPVKIVDWIEYVG